MAKVGWIGLGKLGLPCALVMSRAGHNVIGTDVNKAVKDYIGNGKIPYLEEGVEEAFASGITLGWRDSVAEVCLESEIIFVAVQTPHSPRYEGCNETPAEPRDFDYSYLVTAVKDVARHVTKDTLVVVVSTVNPGTCTREILPILSANPNISFAYSPAFIAMGTTMKDFSCPEMVLIGTSSHQSFDTLSALHSSIHNSPIVKLSVTSCELAKMAYNTFIGLKIVFANSIGEICEKAGGDCDEVTAALSYATERILSPKYMRAGMGDGGGCHPRDQLALSWLANRLDLSVDLFGFVMKARDQQSRWHADLLRDASDISGLDIRICGREFKADSTLVTGSPSRLLMSFLQDCATWQDHQPESGEAAIYFIGVNHSRYLSWRWPHGSIIVDPWGYISDQPGCIVRRIGRRSY